MCAVCGCGATEGDEHTHTAVDGSTVRHAHSHDQQHAHSHDQQHAHSHDEPHAHPHALRPNRLAPASAAASTLPSRLVRLEHDLLERNDALARENRARFEAQGTLALNLMSSPGAGKTTLLVRTLEALRGAVPVAVIEGDQETSLDADRIRATGAPAVQVNTGKACHLDGAMVAGAVRGLPELRGGILFIENVGNLVCPAAFDLGEARRVVIVSVTEGEDKPLKYPYLFARADLVLVTKSDLLPYVALDLARLQRRAAEVSGGAESLVLSARTGEGMDAWLAWLARARAA